MHFFPRAFLHCRLLVGLLILVGGCGRPASMPEVVWGKRGVQRGDFVRPRAIAIDAQDRLYIVDYTARIQVFDRDGNFLEPAGPRPITATAGPAA